MTILGRMDTPMKESYIFEETDLGQLSRVGLAAVRNQRNGFVFRDGKIKSEKINASPRIAADVIKEMSMVENEETKAS